MDALALLLAAGALAGVLAGLFGVGGGLILVPVMTLLLAARQVPATLQLHVAIGTSLAVIALTSIASAYSHHRRGAVLWRALRSFAPGLVLGALLGAGVADALSGNALRGCVGTGALLMALRMLLDRERATHGQGLHANAGELAAVGTAIGLASSLVGIGGGALTVPYLSARGAPIRVAVGTAAAAGVPIAWAGALGFAIAGRDASGLPAGSIGYLDLHAVAVLACGSVLCAPLGAALAHRLPPRLLKRLFALLLLGVAAFMLAG